MLRQADADRRRPARGREARLAALDAEEEVRRHEDRLHRGRQAFLERARLALDALGQRHEARDLVLRHRPAVGAPRQPRDDRQPARGDVRSGMAAGEDARLALRRRPSVVAVRADDLDAADARRVDHHALGEARLEPLLRELDLLGRHAGTRLELRLRRRRQRRRRRSAEVRRQAFVEAQRRPGDPVLAGLQLQAELDAAPAQLLLARLEPGAEARIQLLLADHACRRATARSASASSPAAGARCVIRRTTYSASTGTR